MFGNLKETRSALILNLNICVKNWCTKYDIHKSSLSEWKQNVLKLLDYKIPDLFRQAKRSTSFILKEHYQNNK